MDDPVLLFGVGATKAGTSWLHRYLSDHPQCHFRAIKELHYFNGFDFDDLPRQRAAIEAHKDGLLQRLETDSDARFANTIRQLGHIEHWLTVLDIGKEDTGAYLDYLKGGLEGEHVVGDITPAYSLLSEARLRQMAGLTADVRFIYLMRDPVARVWSHIRMMAKRRKDGGDTLEARAAHLFRRWMRGEEKQLDLRGDYASALTKLRNAVAGEKLLVMFYEDLFSENGVARVCAHLGIDPAPGSFDKRVMEGERLTLSDEDRAMARGRLAPQYEFVAAAMGDLPGAWHPDGKG